jgi:hypothetical protein
MAKEQAHSPTQAVPAWWDWKMVRAGGVGTRGMDKRGRADDKGKGQGDDLIGILKVVAISTSTWFA